jgi:hypothetical protein
MGEFNQWSPAIAFANEIARSDRDAAQFVRALREEVGE